MYPLAAAIIIADSYMNDIASGAISVAEGRKLIVAYPYMDIQMQHARNIYDAHACI